MPHYTIPVPSISCSSCTNAITKHLSKVKEIQELDVSVNHEQVGSGGFVKCKLDTNETFDLKTVLDLIEDMGHEIDHKNIIKHDELKNNIEPIAQDENEPSLNEQQYLYRSLASAAVGLPLMILSMLGITLPLYAMVGVGALSLITMLYAGGDIFKHGIKTTFKTGSFTMDSLFTISTLTAFGVSIAAFFIPGLPFEFETALLIFSSRHLGKYLETKMKQRVAKDLNFKSQLSQTAIQVSENDVTGLKIFKNININMLKAGDIILLNNDDYIPTDGILLSEQAMLYKTFINGNLLVESEKKDGKLYAGMRIGQDKVYMQVTKPLSESYLSKWDQALEKAKNKKTKIETLTEKVIQYFIPGVLAISAITAAIAFPIYGASVAMHSAIAILVGACPCTLGFIAPLTMRVGLNRSAKHGALVQEPEAIEIAKEIETIVFDLNGTLTQGTPKVSNAVIFNDAQQQEIMNAVFLLENSLDKTHNIGLALKNYAQEQLLNKMPSAKNFSKLSQSDLPGIKGNINGDVYLLGNDSLMRSNNIEIQQNPQRIYLAKNNQVIAHFDISDPLHQDAKFTISELQKQGLNVVLCTGASEITAASYAKQLGITQVKAACHGGIAKQEYIQNLDGKVAMVGDAINDSIALKSADIGIAAANADQHSQSVADVIINGEGLLPILHFFKNSKDTMSTLKQNLAMSLLYNLGVMAFTTTIALSLGPVAPGAMAFLMALQSIIVLTNTFKLKQQPLDLNTNIPVNTAELTTDYNCQLTSDFKIKSPAHTQKTCCQSSKMFDNTSENINEDAVETMPSTTSPLIV